MYAMIGRNLDMQAGMGVNVQEHIVTGSGADLPLVGGNGDNRPPSHFP